MKSEIVLTVQTSKSRPMCACVHACARTFFHYGLCAFCLFTTKLICVPYMMQMSKYVSILTATMLMFDGRHNCRISLDRYSTVDQCDHEVNNKIE